MLLLSLLRRRTARTFEAAVAAFGALVIVAFVGGLFLAPPDPMATLRGVVPSIPDSDAWALAAAMLGATVMPHAIYLHSSLAVDRFRRGGHLVAPVEFLLRVQRWDVGIALVCAGTANIAMLLYGAAALQGPGRHHQSAHRCSAGDRTGRGGRRSTPGCWPRGWDRRSLMQAPDRARRPASVDDPDDAPGITWSPLVLLVVGAPPTLV
jgi:manganese transport protein